MYHKDPAYKIVEYKLLYQVVIQLLLRNNLTENAFGTRPKRVLKCVPFAFHLRSICVPFAFHLRSICVPNAFHLRSTFTGTHLRSAFLLPSYRNRTASEIIAISRVLISVTFTFCVYTSVKNALPSFFWDAFQPRSDRVPAAFRPRSDRVPTAFRPRSDRVPTAFRPRSDRVPTAFRSRSDRVRNAFGTRTQC